MNSDLIKKILIVGSKALGSLENCYYRAFRELGLGEIDFFNTDYYKFSFKSNNLIKKAISLSVTPISNYRTNLGLLEKLKQKKFDLIIVFKGMEFSPQMLEKAKEFSSNAIWANINPDDPYNIGSRGSTNQNVLNSIKLYDYYFIWSKRILSKMLNSGISSAKYLPFGFDELYHRPPTKKLAIQQEQVVFIGAWDREREDVLNKLANFDLLIFGNGWDRISKRSLKGKKIFPYNIYLEEFSNAIYNSGITLNILRSQNRNSHNMRTFEIPAVGGLMLTNRTEEQNKFFKENEACYMYSDMDELKEKVKYIIKNPIEAMEIRNEAYRLNRPNSYYNRSNYIKNIVFKMNY